MNNSKNSQEKKFNKSNSNSRIIYTMKKEDLILLIMDFLKNEGYDRTYVSLEGESGINLYNYEENLGILRGFILDGDWEEAEKSLEIFKTKKNFPFKNLIFEIRKEKLIEEVEAQQKDGTFDDLAKELKDLQDLGCNNEFNNLMDYLKETEHDVLNETISRRLEIFNKIRKQITFQYPITKNEVNIQPNKLKEILSKFIEKILLFSKNANKNKNDVFNLKDIDDMLQMKLEIENLNINNIFDNETNKNTIIYNNSLNNYKDSFNESKNNSGKIRRKNNSKTNNHKSAMERLAETYDDLDLYIQEDDFIDKKSKTQKKKNSDKKANKDNKINKNITSKKSFTKQNYNLITKIIKEKKNPKKEPKKNNSFTKTSKTPKSNKDNKGNKNSNQKIKKNANNSKAEYYSNKIIDSGLSDLDQEEYYLKNCYDYYNYDISTLNLKKVISDTHPIRCCCFSPKGDYFALGTNSKSVKIYDLSSILDSLTKKNNIIYNQIPLNKENNTNSIISNSKANKESISLFFEQKNHHFGSIFTIDWSPSGRLLATGSNDKTIKLMNISELFTINSSNKEKKILNDNEISDTQITGNQGTVRSLCFEPGNDNILLSANSGENVIKIWDTSRGINIGYLEGHNSDVNSVKWSNDSQLFASCALDKTVRFWDIREHKNINILSAIQYADINDISVFSKTNNIIVAVGHTDGLMTIWDYSKQTVIKEIYEHNEQIRSVAFSPDGKYLLSGAFDAKIKIYDVYNNFNIIGEIEHGDKVVSCKWHPEIPLIVSTSADKTARVWIPTKF